MDTASACYVAIVDGCTCAKTYKKLELLSGISELSKYKIKCDLDDLKSLVLGVGCGGCGGGLDGVPSVIICIFCFRKIISPFIQWKLFSSYRFS